MKLCVTKNQMFTWVLVVCSACIGSGCSQDGGTSTGSTSDAAATPQASNNAAPAQTKADDSATANAPVAQPAPAVKTASASEAKPEWEAQKPLTIEDDAARRAQAENMISATIRIKMEDMIEKRAELLKSGRPPSDVEVRQLEGSIMRARDLLQEAGEIVEDVEPPIVQVNPR